MDYIKSHSGHDYPRDPNTFLKHTDLINRCFYANSVEEIMHNLQMENTPFAQMCLKKMSSNSMLSMKLTLEMLRRAKAMDYKGCLQLELNVALNKIQDKEFDLGVSEILMKPSRGR